MVAISYQGNLVLFVYEIGSIITAQRRHRREFNKSLLHKNLITNLLKQFSIVGNFKKRKSPERLRILISVDDVREAMLLSPHTTVRRLSLQLQIVLSTFHGILHQRLKFRSYKIQIEQIED